MASKGYPVTDLNELNGSDFTENVVQSAMVISRSGKPQTVEELHERLDRYFRSCANGRMRPGFESLSSAIGVDRTTFWRWTRGENGVSKEWQDECIRARSIIHTYLEQALLTGKINPASGIFLAKNWLNYKDNVSIEESVGSIEGRRSSPAEIAERHGIFVGDKVAGESPLPTAAFLDGGGQDE